MALPFKPEIKASIIQRMKDGEDVSSLAREFRILPSTIRNWLKAEQLDLNGMRGRENGQVLDEAIFDYVVTALECLTIQAQVFSDESYLKTQSAESNAVLHGVVADKAIRILEATSAVAPESNGLSLEDFGNENFPNHYEPATAASPPEA